MKVVFPVLGLLLALLPGRSLWWAADAAEPAADHAPKLIAP